VSCRLIGNLPRFRHAASSSSLLSFLELVPNTEVPLGDPAAPTWNPNCTVIVSIACGLAEAGSDGKAQPFPRIISFLPGEWSP
jgi:hypothetical protein